MLEQTVDVARLVVMKEGAGEVEGELLAVVGSDGELSAQLLLGLAQLSVAEGPCDEAIELATNQSAAALHIVRIVVPSILLIVAALREDCRHILYKHY